MKALALPFKSCYIGWKNIEIHIVWAHLEETSMSHCLGTNACFELSLEMVDCLEYNSVIKIPKFLRDRRLDMPHCVSLARLSFRWIFPLEERKEINCGFKASFSIKTNQNIKIVIHIKSGNKFLIQKLLVSLS